MFSIFLETMSERKGAGNEENIHEKYEREMRAGIRKKTAFVNKEDGLHVDYDEDEFQQFLPHLYGEVQGSMKGKKRAVSSVRSEEEISDDDYDGGYADEDYSGETISEEEHLREYEQELENKKKKINSDGSVSSGIQDKPVSKDEYRAKREALEKLLQPSNEQEDDSKTSTKHQPSGLKKEEGVMDMQNKNMFPKRSKEEIIALTKGKASYHTPDNDELFNPNIISFLRRCQKESEAIEIIDYMLKKGEITEEEAEKYKTQCKKEGVRSFGTYKAPGYYEREFPRTQTKYSRKYEWDPEDDETSG